MSYYFKKENIEEYIKSAEGFNGQLLIDSLMTYTAKGSKLLELGMGPGTDLMLLEENFKTTGSDYSHLFLDKYQEEYPNHTSELLLLDAETLITDQTFDVIYSNKVLYHLSKKALKTSFERQLDLLNDDGLVIHSLWLGEGSEAYEELLFTYYNETSIKEVIPMGFEILETSRYTEMEADDSFYIIMRKSIDYKSK